MTLNDIAARGLSRVLITVFATLALSSNALADGAILPVYSPPPPIVGVPTTGMTPPIQIQSCTVATEGGVFLARSGGSYRIVFTNESKVSADLIQWTISLQGQGLQIRDVGTFEPGETITHNFKRQGGTVTSGWFGGGPLVATCNVALVHFLDGTEWSPASALAAANPRRLGNGWIGAYLAKSGPLVVGLVLPSSPAMVGGLQKGDILTAIDNETITTYPDAVMMFSSALVGSVLNVTVNRDGTLLTLHLTVALPPEGWTP